MLLLVWQLHAQLLHRLLKHKRLQTAVFDYRSYRQLTPVKLMFRCIQTAYYFLQGNHAVQPHRAVELRSVFRIELAFYGRTVLSVA